MVYRPTVRYADEFKEYVNELFHATELDRNQIIRAALFSAAFSPAFQSILEQHIKKDVGLPSAPWSLNHHLLWLEQNPSKQEEGKEFNVIVSREGGVRGDTTSMGDTPKEEKQLNKNDQSKERREGELSSGRIVFRNQGGISIKIW